MGIAMLLSGIGFLILTLGVLRHHEVDVVKIESPETEPAEKQLA
jgi:hypothetical protein